MSKIIIFFFFFIFIISSSYSDNKKKFLMLKNDKVNVRYGPSFDYPIKYIYKKIQLPVQLIDKKENFRRIIDHKKNSGWIHITQLKKSKSLITTSKKILFKKPTKYSKPVAMLDAGRLLLIQKCERNWCNVKTDQFSGWVDKVNVWGNFD
tara:strand:- start:271 stop:720 length:450 start_codon:yes stop_codon:yes gene_type:complete